MTIIEKDNLRLQNIAAKFNAKSIDDEYETARRIALLKAQEKALLSRCNSMLQMVDGETEKVNARN